MPKKVACPNETWPANPPITFQAWLKVAKSMNMIKTW